LKDSRYVVYYDLLLYLQQQEEADEDCKASSADSKHDSKHDDAPLIYREESDGTYDMEVIPRRGGRVVQDDISLDEILENEVNRMPSKTRNIHK
jgi:hypothetical protein